MRLDADTYFMALASVVAARGTCYRRNVGCVLVNSRKHILATGYNGVPSGVEHCRESHLCEGAKLPSGQGLDQCRAIHAEDNALLQCKDVYAIHTAYVTTAPCVKCVDKLKNTSCGRIVFLNDYPQSKDARRVWLQENVELTASMARTWKQFIPDKSFNNFIAAISRLR